MNESFSVERAIGFPLTKICWDHPLLKHHDEIPLRSALILCLHCPHHPSGALISILKGINLSDEVTSQEVDVFTRVTVKVAVVISTSGFAGIWRNVGGAESSIEIFLAVGHSQAELANIGWPIGISGVGNIVARGIEVSRPACWVVCHVVPVPTKALVLVSVNTDVREAIRRGHHGNPVLVGLEGLLQVHHGGGGQVTPDNLIPSRIELISAGGPNLIPPSSWLVEKRDSIKCLPLKSSLLNPLGHVGCNLVLDDDRPRYVGVVLRVVLGHPVDIASASTVVKAILRPWSCM